MPVEDESCPVILLIEDVEETRYLLEKMLKKDGYCVDLARDEEDAIRTARSQSPDLILMSLNPELEQLVATAQRIRDYANLTTEVAVVIFCVSTIPESAEWEVHDNIYATRPDNFDQLRQFLHQLLRKRLSTR
jgi:two-component system nitrogen regulation response regulator GlnG